MLLQKDSIRIENFFELRDSHGHKKLVHRFKYVFHCILGCGREIWVRPEKLSTHTGRCRPCAVKNRSDRTFCHCGLRAVRQRLCLHHFYETHKDALSVINKAWLRSLKGRWSSLKRAIKRTKTPSNIDFQTYSDLIKNPCWYCGEPLNESGHGLDKKDPKSGYTTENVVPCCVICNRIKNKYLTHEEMEVAMKAVIGFRKMQ